MNYKHCECHKHVLIESPIGLSIRSSPYNHQQVQNPRCESLPVVEVHFDQHSAVYVCSNRQHVYNNDGRLSKGTEKESR